MQDSHNKRVTSFYRFFFLCIFFVIDFFALCFFQQTVTLFLFGALSRLMLMSSFFLVANSIFLLGLQAALSGFLFEYFLFFLISTSFLAFVLKKTVYKSSILQIFFSFFMIILYVLCVGKLSLFSLSQLCLCLLYLITGLFAAEVIGFEL